MSVGNVNNSNNNTGLCVAGAAAVGAGAGVATGYLTKPYLKNGMPTDTFTSEVAKGFANRFSHLDRIKPFEFNNAVSDIGNISSVNALKDLINGQGNKLWNGMLIFEGDLDSTRKLLNKAIDPKNLTKSKKKIINMILAEKSKLPTEIASDLFAEACHKDGFKLPTKISGFFEEGAVDVIQKASKNIQGKAAIIYGAIGAVAAGTVALLCCGGKKNNQ